MIVFLFDSFLDIEYVESVMTDLNSGRSALVFNRNTLIYGLKYMHMMTHDSDLGFFDRIHISKHGRWNGSLFYLVTKINRFNLFTSI